MYGILSSGTLVPLHAAAREGFTVRVAILSLAFVLTAVPVLAQELIAPIEMANAGQEAIFFLYPDNQVWVAFSNVFHEVPGSNRGVEVVHLTGMDGGAKLLYADNQVWSLGALACTFYLDVTRPDDPNVRAVALSSGCGIVIGYEDGQVWNHDGQLLRRVNTSPCWERPNPTSGLEDPAIRETTWGAIRSRAR